MSDFTPEEIELRGRILEYLGTKDKAKNRDVANALNVKKKEVDKMINELAKEGELEFLYLGTSFVKLKDKE